MLFPSLTFLLFFPPVYTLSWLSSKRLVAWKLVLTLASCVFYGFWSIKFLGLLLASCFWNWLFGYFIGQDLPERGRKWLLGLGIAGNLAVLGTFKYYKFFYVNLIHTFPALDPYVPALEVMLPIGVSFYSFQGISYLMDVYRREVKAAPILDVFCYKLFFPQLVAGPIVRASVFLPQIEKLPQIDKAMFNRGLTLVVGGLVLKLFVANYLAQAIVDPVFAAPAGLGRLQLLTAVYAYAIQIYCDFNGYTLMAIGLALLLGISLPPNFNMPYFATSLQDFWRRWHMSLSGWLRDYLYIPLGGSKLGPARIYLNLMIVMTLGGLWHGAAWNFLVWGMIHGVVLCLERLMGNFYTAIPMIIRWFITFHIVCLAWIFFRAADFETAATVISGIVSGPIGPPAMLGVYVLIALPVLFDASLHCYPQWIAALRRVQPLQLAALGAMATCLILLVAPPSEAPFIYFQF